MWWVVVVLALIVVFSYTRKYQEGMDEPPPVAPDDPAVRQMLQSNERTLQELKEKVDKIAPLAEQVAALKRRVEASNTKLDSISEMCVTCTKKKDA